MITHQLFLDDINSLKSQGFYLYNTQNSNRINIMKITKDSEEKFRRIFDDSPIGIELYNRNGNLLEENKASMKIFGISDVIDVSNYNFFEDPNTPETIKESLEFGKITRFEKIYDFDQIKRSNLYETSKSGKIFHDVLLYH